nr:hypothetical protein [Streptomyces sp. S063]
MRAIRVAPLALLGAGALTLIAPSAAFAAPDGASSTFNPTITPSVIAPGGRVTLGAGGCTGETTVSSGIFDTTTIPSGSTTATATVDSDARRGAVYAVTFTCGSTGTSRNRQPDDHRRRDDQPHAHPAPTPTTVPTASSTALVPGGVRGGLGGSTGATDTVEVAAGGPWWSRRPRAPSTSRVAVTPTAATDREHAAHGSRPGS